MKTKLGGRIFWKPPKKKREEKTQLNVEFSITKQIPRSAIIATISLCFFLATPTSSSIKNIWKKETYCGKGIGGGFVGPTKCLSTFHNGVPNLILVVLHH